MDIVKWQRKQDCFVFNEEKNVFVFEWFYKYNDSHQENKYTCYH